MRLFTLTRLVEGKREKTQIGDVRKKKPDNLLQNLLQTPEGY